MESTIPIIDLSAMCLGKTAESSTALEIRQLADEIYRAFCTVGFVYIKNHGIPREKVRISFLGLFLLNRNEIIWKDSPLLKEELISSDSSSSEKNYNSEGEIWAQLCGVKCISNVTNCIVNQMDLWFFRVLGFFGPQGLLESVGL